MCQVQYLPYLQEPSINTDELPIATGKHDVQAGPVMQGMALAVWPAPPHLLSILPDEHPFLRCGAQLDCLAVIYRQQPAYLTLCLLLYEDPPRPQSAPDLPHGQ
jgi:hypothetical protein